MLIAQQLAERGESRRGSDGVTPQQRACVLFVQEEFEVGLAPGFACGLGAQGH